MAKKPKKLPYDSRGGVMVVSRAMRESSVYVSMPATAKVLMDLLHLQWKNDKLVSYGIREAAAKIPCNAETAVKMFRVLQERGFIVCAEQSQFSSRTGSRARSWRLTWLPFDNKCPTHDWEKPLNLAEKKVNRTEIGNTN